MMPGALATVFLLVVSVFVAVPTPAGAEGVLNAVEVENSRPGTDRWRLWREADDVSMQVKGYADATSVNVGQAIRFHVSVSEPQSVRVDVYRMGWYGGEGADARGRLHTSMDFDGITQAAPVVDGVTGMVTTNWSPSASITIPDSWVSGNYLAKLTRADGYDNHIPFVVRDDGRAAEVLVQLPYTTYQAYNNFPGDGSGKSLYDFNSGGPAPSNGPPDQTRADRVSFDRPYAGRGAGQFFNWDFAAIRWIEKQGYDAVYSTNIDTHGHGQRLQNYRAFVSLGHDEYWTATMYDAAEAARDSGGTNLAFFGANTVYWRIDLRSSATGVPNRIVYSQRRDRVDRWREAGRPEQQLVGIQYLRPFNFQHRQLVVANADSFAWQGVGVSDGSKLGPSANVFDKNLVGYEVDGVDPNHPGPITDEQIFLSASSFHCIDGRDQCPDSEKNIQRTSLYKAPSGSWVFASGTMGWSYGLGSQDYPTLENSAIQQVTANILDRFLEGAPPAMTMERASSIRQLIRAADYDARTGGDVLRLYRAFFDREPDMGGARYWLHVRRTHSLTEIAQFFTGSKEYRNNYSGTSDREFLTRLYVNVLGREYDQGGFDYWLGLLESGTSRGAVVRWVTASVEFRMKHPY